MAKAKARPAPRPAAGGKSSSGTKALILIAIVMVVPFSLPTFILLFVTMLPTLAAALGDRSTHRYAWLSVGGLNFAGSAPWLLDLWFGVYTIEAALGMATQVSVVMMAWMAAAFGYMLHVGCPPIAGAILKINHQRRVGKLRDQQKELVELWGQDVTRRGDDDDLL